MMDSAILKEVSTNGIFHFMQQATDSDGSLMKGLLAVGVGVPIMGGFLLSLLAAL